LIHDCDIGSKCAGSSCKLLLTTRTARHLNSCMRPKIFASILLTWLAASILQATELGIDHSRFTINGKTKFLFGISYYAGLGASSNNVQNDLDTMQRDGFNWIRIWANWGGFDMNISSFQMDGTAREPFFGRLKSIVAECDKRGMIVDITLARENGAKEPPGLRSMAEHERAVRALVEELKPYRNWYLDLANERNIQDNRFVSFEELRRLRSLIRELDSKRLVTASHSSDDADLLKNLDQYLGTVRVDFIAQHRSRARGSAQETENATRQILGKMKELGFEVPVLYQEPFRRGYETWEPTTEDFQTDLNGAIQGGAGGWCFHNGSQRKSKGGIPRRSFDLRETRLYDQLDSVEIEVTKAVRATSKRP
jgi:hypothetical protein